MAAFLELADDLAVPEILVDEAVNHATDQIDRENFVNQGTKENKILEPVQNCKAEQNKVDAYSNLYSHLVEKKVIIQTIGAATAITWWGVSTIDPKKTDTSTLKSLLTPLDVELYCYSLNYEELSSFLKNYKYVSSDQIAIISTAQNEEAKQRQEQDQKKKVEAIPQPMKNAQNFGNPKKPTSTKTKDPIKEEKKDNLCRICEKRSKMCKDRKERNVGGKRTKKAKRKSKRAKN